MCPCMCLCSAPYHIPKYRLNVMCVYACADMAMYIFDVCMYTYILLYVWMDVFTYIYLYVLMYGCMNVCVYIYIFIFAHVYAYSWIDICACVMDVCIEILIKVI